MTDTNTSPLTPHPNIHVDLGPMDEQSRSMILEVLFGKLFGNHPERLAPAINNSFILQHA